MSVTMNAVRLFVAILSLTGIVVVACKKPANIDLPEHKPALVMHGLVATGDTFVIALGKTIPSQGPLALEHQTYVTNGWVLLYEGNVFLDSLKYDAATERYVSSNRVAFPGRTYTIKAGAPGYPTAEAESIAPAPVPTISFARKQKMRKSTSGGWLDDLTFTFNDPTVERNYYIAAVHGPGGNFGIMCVYSYDPAVEKYSNELLAFDGTSCIDNDRIMYNDKTFNGSLKELTVSADAYALEPYRDSQGNTWRAYLKRYHVTEEYYRYFRSSARPMLETGPGFFEPHMVKGNVRNGYGLFTVFSASTDTIY